MPTFLVSFPNQSTPLARIFCLAAVDTDSGTVRWIRSGATAGDLGTTGLALIGDHLYCVIQSKKRPRLNVIDTRSWRIVQSLRFRKVGDPHSIAVHAGDLLVVSSRDNAVYRMRRHGWRVLGEELVRRFPGTSATTDDIHVNSICTMGDAVLVTVFGRRAPDGRWACCGKAIDLWTGATMVQGLSQPHSLGHADGRVFLASSSSGAVWLGTPAGPREWAMRTYAVGGYPRGLACRGGEVYVAISAPRTISKSTGRPLPGTVPPHPVQIVRLNPATGRTEPLADLTAHGGEIYDILLWDRPLPPPTAAPTRSPFLERMAAWRARLA
ncbi:MAG: DUF4915 domain-containing protein [Solirubrobacterales bacterium]